MPRKVKVVKEEVQPKGGRGGTKNTPLELEKVKVLLKELAKVKEPVKTQRRANKKQDALDVKDFIHKRKPKDQLTQLLEGIRIKRALDAQYKKIVEKANEKLKKDIIDTTTKSKDREISDRIKAEELKVITDKRDAELLVLDEAKYQTQLRRQRILDAQTERRQLLLTDQRQQEIERRQNLLEDARDIRRDTVQDLRQQEIEDREEAKYQQRQVLKITRPRGRPIGSYSTLPTLDADDGSYSETAFKTVSQKSLVEGAIEAGVSATGKKEAIARRIVNSKPELEKAADLFNGLTNLANKPHNPTLAITPDILTGTKLNLTPDEEGVLPIGKVESIPSKKPIDFLANLTAGLGKKLKKSEKSGLLDTQADQDAAEATLRRDKERVAEEIANRPKASRANMSYAKETVDGMIAELKHRDIPLPARSKLVYVKGNPIQQDIPLSDYKQLLFAEMKNSYRK
jgi:hypothetical protein